MKKRIADRPELDAEAVAQAFIAQSDEHKRLFREAEVNAALTIKMKLMREECGISQTELAERIGRKQSFVARLEQGGYDRCEIMTLRTILRAMGYDFAFSQMFCRLSGPGYSGQSSCTNLELALEGDDLYKRNVGELVEIRHIFGVRDEATPLVPAPADSRGASSAA